MFILLLESTVVSSLNETFSTGNLRKVCVNVILRHHCKNMYGRALDPQLGTDARTKD